MKHLKIYEEVETLPKIGDYVICNMADTPMNVEHYKFIKFMNNNIGKIIDLENHRIIVKYNNIPKYIQSYFGYDNNTATHIYINEIKLLTKTLEDMKIQLTANKFNL